MRNFSISFLLTGIILSVVYKNNHDISPGSKFVRELYELSADTITIDTSNYFLETFLCRNSTGSNNENSSGNVIALIYLVNAGNLRIPTNIYINNLYVINREDVWKSSPSSPQSATPEFILTKVSDEVPDWQLNDQVDVIAEVSDTLRHRTLYIIARNQRLADL